MLRGVLVNGIPHDAAAAPERDDDFRHPTFPELFGGGYCGGGIADNGARQQTCLGLVRGDQRDALQQSVVKLAGGGGIENDRPPCGASECDRPPHRLQGNLQLHKHHIGGCDCRSGGVDVVRGEMTVGTGGHRDRVFPSGVDQDQGDTRCNTACGADVLGGNAFGLITRASRFRKIILANLGDKRDLATGASCGDRLVSSLATTDLGKRSSEHGLAWPRQAGDPDHKVGVGAADDQDAGATRREFFMHWQQCVSGSVWGESPQQASFGIVASGRRACLAARPVSLMTVA